MDNLIIYILGIIAFLCFLPLIKFAVKPKPTKPLIPLTVACETPKGWQHFKTHNLRVYRNGTWNFTSLEGRDVSASNCFLDK